MNPLRQVCIVCCGLLVLGTALAAPAPQPDFKVEVLVDKQNRSVRMAVRVTNFGNAPAAPSTLGVYWKANAGGPPPIVDGPYDLGPPVEPGGTPEVRLMTPPLPVGGSVVVEGPKTKQWPNGAYLIKARADIRHFVAESNENNNSGQAPVNFP